MAEQAADTGRIDVLAVGNAIVDVIARTEDDFLHKHGLPKGGMTLIDSEWAEALYESMGPGTEMSGGSAANTLAGIASLGGTTAFLGKVRDDQLGRIFRHDIRAAGATFETAAATEGLPTARCLVFVTPDAQRTMATFLGASTRLGPEDVDFERIRRAQVTYLEGFLWDAPEAKQAFIDAAKTAREAGGEVALSLSDPFCVERHRDSFRELVDGHVDILFANGDEIASLYEVDTFDEAVDRVRGSVRIAALTRGEHGSVVVTPQETVEVAAVRPERIEDTTGAGDLYAAGFLYAYTRGHELRQCARLAGACAAEVISHVGARPARDLRELLGDVLGEVPGERLANT